VEPIVAALLYASDKADDWDAGKTVLDKLESNLSKSASFKDPITYNLVGVAALNTALSDPKYYAIARTAFDRGLRNVTPENAYANWYLHFNRWRLFLATENGSSAKGEIEKLKTLTPPPDTDSWKTARTWKWFRLLLEQHPNLGTVAEESYKAMFPASLGTRQE
jgi:hypothetical protein